MARTKQQYIDQGRRDAETFPRNINRPLYDSASWQGQAYKAGCDERVTMVAEAKRELDRRNDCPACAAGLPIVTKPYPVQSIAPDQHERAGVRLGNGTLSLDGKHLGTVKNVYARFADSASAQRRADRIQSMVRGYLSAMVWTTTDDDGNECDDMEPSGEARAEAMAIVTAFYDANGADLGAYADLRLADVGSTYNAQTARQLEAYGFAGHDLWLTAAGHGVGFWDRGHGRVGERLTKAAKVYQGCDAYVSDAGLIELSVPFHASWKKV